MKTLPRNSWALLALALLFCSKTAYALPSIENLQFVYDTNASGAPICNSVRLTFTYGANPGNDTAWGLTIFRDGHAQNSTSVVTRSSSGVQTLGANLIGNVLVSDRPYTFQVVAYNARGTGAYSAVVGANVPPCDGSAPDGQSEVFAAHLLVSFSDFAHIPPFTVQQYETQLLTSVLPRTGQGQLSLTDFFRIVSKQEVEVRNAVNPWITLPHPLSYYCGRTMYQAAYRGLTLGYDCNTVQIRTDALAVLAQNGTTINATIVNVIVNGMGATGFGGVGTTSLSADSLFYHMTHREALAFDALAHEMGHALGLGHANSFRACANGVAPTDLLDGANGIQCQHVRYGTSMMGGTARYAGFAAAQRNKLGWFDDTDVELLSYPSSATVDLVDLDTVSTRKKLLLVETPWLPPTHNLFAEYTKDNAAFANAVVGVRSVGVRVGVVFSHVPEVSDPTLAYAGDGQVIYFDDVFLRDVGNKVTLAALDLELEILAKDADGVNLAVRHLPSFCEPAPVGFEVSGVSPRVNVSVSNTFTVTVDNEDVDCAPSRVEVVMTDTLGTGTPVVLTQQGTLKAGASRAFTFSHAFSTVGTHNLEFTVYKDGVLEDSYEATVVVTPPCTRRAPTVTWGSWPGSVRVGGQVAMRATVTNTDSYCPAATLQLDMLLTPANAITVTPASASVASGASAVLTINPLFTRAGFEVFDLVVRKDGVNVVTRRIGEVVNP